MLKLRDSLKVGDVTDYSSFTSAVIDDKAFARIKSYIDHARSSKNLEILGGGQYDDSKGYFVQPTIVESKDPLDKIMTEEIFGPVLSIYVYKDKDVDKALELVGSSTKFALTGAIFAQDEYVDLSLSLCVHSFLIFLIYVCFSIVQIVLKEGLRRFKNDSRKFLCE